MYTALIVLAVTLMEHLLADLGADDAAEALPALLRTLRRRGQLRHTSAALRSRWCERLTALMRSDRQRQRCAGAALAAESVQQLDEPTFAAFRDGWAGALISMATQRGSDASSRRHAAGALASLLAVTARFPSQRREMAPHVPRVVHLLLSMIERDSPALATTGLPNRNGPEELGHSSPDAELRALASLRLLALSCPHALRPSRDRLQHALARMVLEPTRDGSAPDASTSRAVTAAAELLASLPGVCAGAGPAFADAWLANVTLLLGTLQALLARALGSVTDRPLSRMTLPQLGGIAAGAGAENGGDGGGEENGSTGGGALSGGAGLRGPMGAGSGTGGVGLADAVGRGAASSLAEREAIVCAATGLVRAIHACLHPPALASGVQARGGGAPALAGGVGRGVAAGGGAPALDVPVPIPVRAMCELGLMVLAHDGALPLPAPAPESLRHSALQAILPECHVLALQLLHSVVGAARRHALPHAEAICDALQLCWRRTDSSRDGCLRCPRLRIAAYELASSVLRLLGGSVAPHLATALADAAARDLGGAGNEADDAGWASAGRVSGGKRARGGGELPVIDFVTNASGMEAPPAPEAVRVAAARAVHALLSSAGSLTPYNARLRCQHCLLTIAEAEAAECPPAVSGLSTTATASAAGGSATSPPSNVPPRSSNRLLASVLRALHASVCTGDSSPQALARTVVALCAARDGAGSAEVVLAATDALHSLEALLHPSGVPRWPRPVHPSVQPTASVGISHPVPALQHAPAQGQGCTLEEHSVPPLAGQVQQPAPSALLMHARQPDHITVGGTALGAAGSAAAMGTPLKGAPQACALATLVRPLPPAPAPPATSSPSPHVPLRVAPQAGTSSAGSVAPPSQAPVSSVALPAAQPAVRRAAPPAAAAAVARPTDSAAPGDESDSSDPEIMLDGPDGG